MIRRSDSGSRGRMQALCVLVALLVPALVSADGAKTAVVSSTDGTSVAVMSSSKVEVSKSNVEATTAKASTVGDTSKATTLRPMGDNERWNYCMDLPGNITAIDIHETCGSNIDVKSKETFDFSNEDEENIKKLFSSLQSARFDANLIISKSSISTIDFGNTRNFGYGKTPSLVLTNNKKLTKISSISTLITSGKVTIRGNRLLDTTSLPKFRIVGVEEQADIQEGKECFQDDAFLDEYNGCERIYGDLQLTNFNDSNYMPIAISGCLELKGIPGELDVEKFLQKFDGSKHDKSNCNNKISGYCLKNEVLTSLKKKFEAHGRKIEIKNAGTCTYICTGNDLELEQEKCTTLHGDIVITNGSNLALFGEITEVLGTLTIDGLEEIPSNFLNSLRNITSTDNEAPALTIKNNAHAPSFDLGYIKNITSPAEKKFVFENNGFNCSNYLKDQLSKALGHPEYCGEKPPNQPVIQAIETSTKLDTNGQNAKIAGNSQKEDSSSTDSGMSSGAIAGIVVGILLPIILIGAAIGLAIFFIKRKKSKNSGGSTAGTGGGSGSLSAAELTQKANQLEEERKKREDEERKEEENLHEQHNNELKKHAADVKEVVESVLNFTFEKKTRFEAYKAYYLANKEFNTNVKGKKTTIKKEDRKTFDANKKLTRYNNLVCFEYNRFKLTLYQKELENNDFIHANEIHFKEDNDCPLKDAPYSFKDRFIATQYPIIKDCIPFVKDDKKEKIDTKTTDDRFFTMIEELKAPAVVQLQEWVDIKEPADKTTLGKYIPLDTGSEQKTSSEMFLLKNIKSENSPADNPMVVLRTIEIHKIIEKKPMKTEKKHTFLHVYMLNWPDHKVPEGGLHGRFKLIWNILKKAQPANENIPVVVHCRAGVGRTLAFIIAMHMISAAEESLKLVPTDIVALFKQARKQRYLGVQDISQFLMLPTFLFDMLLSKCANPKLIDLMKEFNAEYLNEANIAEQKNED